MDLFMDISRSGDLVYVNGPTLAKTNLPDVVAQRVYIKLRTFAGEWLFDENYGVDYLGQILGKRLVSKEFIDGLIQEAILDVEGVSEIVSWESSISASDRIYTCKFKIREVQTFLVSQSINIQNIL